MNRDTLEGQWKAVRGRVREHWGKLTDDDIEEINGRAEVLEGKIQERYGKGREDASREVDAFCRSC